MEDRIKIWCDRGKTQCWVLACATFLAMLTPEPAIVEGSTLTPLGKQLLSYMIWVWCVSIAHTLGCLAVVGYLRLKTDG